MDLLEIRTDSTGRHPWELSRVKALRSILSWGEILSSSYRILDLGSGDGFIVSELFSEVDSVQIDAVDINLSASLIEKYSSQYKKINFYNSYDSLEDKTYDLILLLDVVEHLKNDVAFISKIIDQHSTQNTSVLITAPALNSLFSSRDVFLKHYRRYNLKELLKLLENAGLRCRLSGYLFFMLLPCRYFSLHLERFRKSKDLRRTAVGKWNGGYLLTNLIFIILNLDNSISILLNRLGIKIPGLTAWVLCQKQQ